MGKGKVHPSSSPSPPTAGGGAGAGEMTTVDADADAAGEMRAEPEPESRGLMRMLPATVLAAAAPLGPEGKDVLASLRSSASARGGGDGKAAGEQQHRPELGCGCFGCYKVYWSRWDRSPEVDRDAIHRAIEAFKEHLAEEEKDRGKGGDGSGEKTRTKKRRLLRGNREWSRLVEPPRAAPAPQLSLGLPPPLLSDETPQGYYHI